MRCEICQKTVFGKNGVTILGLGAAHAECFEMEKNKRRIFAGVNISKLDDQALNELHDMVIAEKNTRADNFEQDSVELF